MGEVAEKKGWALIDMPVFQSHLSGVIDEVRALIEMRVPAGVLRSLCGQGLAKLESDVREQGAASCIDVPYFLCHGLCEDAQKSRAAASLSVLIYLGCDILDDLHDHELPPEEPAYASLVGTLFLAALPALAVGGFFDLTDPARFAVCQAMSESLLKMAKGQAGDIQSRFNANISAEEVEAIIVAKSGEEMALFCSFSALLADQGEEVRQNCAKFGRDLATALQITSDVADIFEKASSNDLREGTLTLPLSLHFLRLEKKERELFCRLWRESSHNPDARRLLQKALRKSGALAHAALMIESYCEKAGETLKSLPLCQESRPALEEVIDEMSCYAIFHLRSFLNKTDDKQMSSIFMGM